MFDIKEYAEKVNQIKKQGGVVTNNYLNMLTLKQVSEQESSKLLYNQETMAVICNENEVTRLYFYLSALDRVEYLGKLLQTTSIRPIVAEYIGKQLRMDEIVEKLCQVGFLLRATMNRWRSVNIDFFAENLYKGKGFRQANLNDVEDILKILHNTFDIYVSHLPSKEQLIKLVEASLVFCLDVKDRIVAVVCLERVGTNGIYLYQDAVIEKYRSTGVGMLLMQFALSHYKDWSNYTSWIESGNSASNRMHQKLGMTPDGLKCAVLLYQ